MTVEDHLKGLDERTQAIIRAEARKRVAESPPPSAKALEAVGRLVQLFRIENEARKRG